MKRGNDDEIYVSAYDQETIMTRAHPLLSLTHPV